MSVEFEPRGRARSYRAHAPRGSSRLLARHGVRARVHRVPGGRPRRARLSRRRVSRLTEKVNFHPTPRVAPAGLDDEILDQRVCKSSLLGAQIGNPQNPSRAHTARRRSDVHTDVDSSARTDASYPSRTSPAAERTRRTPTTPRRRRTPSRPSKEGRIKSSI